MQLKVKRVIDGDTFEGESGEIVRLIGINTPEISDLYGQAAKEHLEMLIGDKIVELRIDQISSDRDRYNRLLRYVYIDELDINKKMIIDGYAFAYLKYHFGKSYEYEQAQIKSKELNQGIWSNEKKYTEDVVKENGKEPLLKAFSQKKYILLFFAFILLVVGLYHYYRK